MTDLERLKIENKLLRKKIRNMEFDHKGEVRDLIYEIGDLNEELRAVKDELYDTQNGLY